MRDTVTPSPITVPGLYDLSGPSSGVSRPTSFGARDATCHVGETVDLGFDVEHPRFDYARDADRAVAVYDSVTAANRTPLVLGWGGDDTSALAGCARDDGIVYLTASSSPRFQTAEYPCVFSAGLDYTSQARAHLDWVSETAPGATVSFAYPDRPVGRAVVEGGERYADELGLDVGPDAVLPFGAESVTSQLERVREAGVDYLVAHSIADPTRALLEDRQSVAPDLGVLGLSWTVDEVQVARRPDLYEGVRFVNSFDTFREAFEGSGRGSEAVRTAFDRYRPDGDPSDESVANLHYVRGFVHVLLAVTALRNAVENGDDPADGRRVRDGMFDLDGWDAWGLSEPLAFDEGDRRPTVRGRLYEVADGSLEHETTVELPRRPEWIGT